MGGIRGEAGRFAHLIRRVILDATTRTVSGAARMAITAETIIQLIMIDTSHNICYIHFGVLTDLKWYALLSPNVVSYNKIVQIMVIVGRLAVRDRDCPYGASSASG